LWVGRPLRTIVAMSEPARVVDDPGQAIAPARSAWWARALASLPLGALYALARLLEFLAARVVPYRPAVVRENLSIAFPDLDARALAALARRYYAGYADVMVEIVKAVSIEPEALQERVELENPGLLAGVLERGRPVIVMAAHQCNWEWMLLALSQRLGYPLDAAYKPLVDPWAEREMRAIRTRFGARLVPADRLLLDMMARRGVVRMIAMVADQEPVASERRQWLRFLNRDSAFFTGAEEIARRARYPVVFAGMERVSRGRYRVSFRLLWDAAEPLPAGAITERYAAVVEEQIRRSPADWPWSHKRWRLRRAVPAGAESGPADVVGSGRAG
jgi:KDO2-lipid IV(A) lauroyltransferase